MLVADAALSGGLRGRITGDGSLGAQCPGFGEGLERCYSQVGVEAVVACFIPPPGAISAEVLSALSEVAAASGKTMGGLPVGRAGSRECRGGPRVAFRPDRRRRLPHPPLTDVDVADLIRSVRAAPRLTGYRGLRGWMSAGWKTLSPGCPAWPTICPRSPSWS